MTRSEESRFVEIREVAKVFGAVRAVDSVSLDIAGGEFFSLLGPSGCGKTTLLRMLGGFEIPESGRVRIDGADITDAPPHQRAEHPVALGKRDVPPFLLGDQDGGGVLLVSAGPEHRGTLPDEHVSGRGTVLVRRAENLDDRD